MVSPQPAPPQVYTYHCICLSLLLGTTHVLSKLPTRQSVDKAIILPLPPAPTIETEDEQRDGGGNDRDAEMEDGNAAPPPPPKNAVKNKAPVLSELGYPVLLSMTTDTRPTIVRREDGFEKRYLHRCGRCLLVLGYELDDTHFPADGNKVKILYILPGGMMSTGVMAQGKKIEEAEVELGEKATVQAWD